MVQEGALVPVAKGGDDSGQLWLQRERASESRRKPGGSAGDGLGVNGMFIIGESALESKRDGSISISKSFRTREIAQITYGYPLSIFLLN
jgi:hypothetical protein